MVESGDACDCAAGSFVESGAVDTVGDLRSIGVGWGGVGVVVAQWVSGAEVGELLEDIEGDPPFTGGRLAGDGDCVGGFWIRMGG